MPPSAYASTLRLACAAATAAGLLLGAPLTARAAPTSAPGPACETAAPRLCVVPDPDAPTVTAVLALRAGAADEPPDATGVAHLVEHLLHLHEPTVSPLAAFGNASVDATATRYVWTVPAARAGDVFAAMRGVLDPATFTPEAVATEQAAILRERETRLSAPGARLAFAARAALLAGTPLGRDVIGRPREILALDAAAASDFHAAAYAPERAVLVVAGPLSIAAIRAEIGLIGADDAPADPADAAPIAIAPAPTGRVAIAVADRSVRAPERTLAALVRLPAEDGARAGLDVLLAYLNGRLEGAPHAALVEDAEAVRMLAVEAREVAPGWFVVEVGLALRPGRPIADLDAAEAAWTGYLERLRREGLSPETVARLGARGDRAVRAARRDADAAAWSLAHALLAGRSLDAWRGEPETLAATSAEAVAAAVDGLARPHRLVAADLVPLRAAPSPE